MNLLGVPVILGIDKRIKAHEEYLKQLQEEQQKYIDMIETYNYNKEQGFKGTVEAKDQQFPDENVQIISQINMLLSEDYGMFVQPIVMIHNGSAYNIKVLGIETKYSVLGGKENSVKYPFSKLGSLHDPSDLDGINKFEGWIYELINGKVLMYDVDNYIGSAAGIKTIAPGSTGVFLMPCGFCNILDPDGSGDVNKPYWDFLYGGGGIVKGGESTDITLFWKSDDPSNPGGRCIFGDVKGDVYKYNNKILIV